MADRYWVGGSGEWGDTLHWATSSGGAGGASVPTSSDDVYLTTASGTGGIYTDTYIQGSVYNAVCRNIYLNNSSNSLVFSNAAAGPITIAGSVFITTSATAVPARFVGGGSYTIASNLYSATVASGVGSYTLAGVTLTGPLVVESGACTLTGTCNIPSLVTTGDLAKQLTIAGATINITSTAAGTYGVDLDGTNLTLSAAGSTITIQERSVDFNGGGKVFATVAFSYASGATAHKIVGANTFDALTFGTLTANTFRQVDFYSDQTIGTLATGVPTNARRRTMLRSNTIGSQRTLRINSATLTYVDFRDINVEGAAAPLSGTRLGDCKGNTGVVFEAPKTVYAVSTAGGNWIATNWALTAGGAADATAYPLPQDTAVFTDYAPNSGGAYNLAAGANIANIDASARTLPMSLTTASANCSIYGNITASSAVTFPGTARPVLCGRGVQILDIASGVLSGGVVIASPDGEVRLAKALTINTSALILDAGTLELNGYTLTLQSTAPAINVRAIYPYPKRLQLSGGALVCKGNFTVASSGIDFSTDGTGRITMYTPYVFTGRGIHTYPTLRIYSSYTFTAYVEILQSNTFAGIEVDPANAGGVGIRFPNGGITRFTSMNLVGSAGKRIVLAASSTADTAALAVLKRRLAWNVGENSANLGRSVGLTFVPGDMDYVDFQLIDAQRLPVGDMDAVQAPDTVRVIGGIWTREDDSQTPNWGAVDDGQTPGWEAQTPSQTPNWGSVADAQTPNWGPVADAQDAGWDS